MDTQAGMPADRLPWDRRLGATPRTDGTVEFRVWAPDAERVAVRVGDREHELHNAGLGVWEAAVEARAGEGYAYVLDGGDELPDPASRWQPDGLRGRSRIVDARAFEWRASGWRTPPLEDLVLYELHVGTFSPEGTFEGAIPYLAELADLGVNAVEIMPVAEFPGARGWGYDGVYLSAAQSSYGGPHGLQRFVDAAHAAGLAVILDVVYNHVGASGVTALTAFGPYFTEKYETPWGKAMNFDDARCDPVREWVLQSAEGWIRDFRLDGLRLDAIHAIHDGGAEHLVAALTRRVHGASSRALVIAESGMNDPKVMRPAPAGWGCDAAWADDFHHALRALLTGDRSGWYEEFGEIAHLVKALHRPHVHDGIYSTFRQKRFGAPAGDRAPEQFVVFSANHDQVGNRAFGDRLPAEVRPLAAFATLLSPFTPMIWQGEEYGEPAPFQFFSDHIDEEIAEATRNGRRSEFAAFAEFAGEEVPDPQAEQTFLNSKLTRERDEALHELHRRLLELRRRLPREPDRIDGNGAEGWVRDRRGRVTIVCNFADQERRVPIDGEPDEVVVATHDARLEGGHVILPARSGAVVR
jgi:maltooligosyltrehalose trehalohydrolase